MLFQNQLKILLENLHFTLFRNTKNKTKATIIPTKQNHVHVIKYGIQQIIYQNIFNKSYSGQESCWISPTHPLASHTVYNHIIRVIRN